MALFATKSVYFVGVLLVDAVVATDRAAGLTFAHQSRSYRHVAAKLQTLLHTIMEFYRRFEHFSDVFLAK